MYLPLCRERGFERVGPLFPRYLFIRFDVGADQWRRIYRTRGIAGLIGIAVDRPTPVPVGIVEGLIGRTSTCRIVDDPGYAEVKPGDCGQIVEGPWAGWSGICTVRARDRVALLLSVFGREQVVDCPRFAVIAA